MSKVKEVFMEGGVNEQNGESKYTDTAGWTKVLNFFFFF